MKKNPLLSNLRCLISLGLLFTTNLSAEVERIDVNPRTGEPGNAISVWGGISGDGRYIGFVSRATDITDEPVPTLPGNASNLIERDRNSGVSEAYNVDRQGNVWSVDAFPPSYSIDGERVVFLTRSGDVMMKTRSTGNIEMVNLNWDGTEDSASNSILPILSGSGRYLAYVSLNTDVVADWPSSREDHWDVFQLYLRDLRTGENTLVSRGLDGRGANYNISFNSTISMSANGAYLVYSTRSNNISPVDQQTYEDVFLYTPSYGTTSLISRARYPGRIGNSKNPVISAGGRSIVFESTHAGLVPNDTNQVADVFHYDRYTGVIQRISKGDNFEQLTTKSFAPSVSGNGRFVGYGTKDGYFIYDRISGLQFNVWSERSFVSAAQMSSDGKTVILSGQSGGVWSVDTGIGRFPGGIIDNPPDNPPEES